MYRLIEDRQVPLTREFAKECSELPKPKGQDKRDKVRREEFIRQKIADGLFYPPTWASAWCQGKQYLVNGNHSSRVLANLEDPNLFPVGMHVHWMVFEVNDDMGLAELFMQFDSSQSARTIGETFAVHGAVEPQLSEFKPTWLSKAAAGIASWMNEGNNGRMPVEKRVTMLHKNVDFVSWAVEFIQSRYMGIPPVVGAMYGSYRVCRDDADSFWRMVRDQSHPDPQHPTRVLAEFLKSRLLDANNKRKWSHRDTYQKCIHAWNAYRKGTRTALKVYRDAENLPSFA